MSLCWALSRELKARLSGVCLFLFSDPRLWSAAWQMGWVAGGPWPFNIVGSWARAGPVLGWSTSDGHTPGLGRDEAEQSYVDGGGRLARWRRVRGGQSCKPGQGCDSLRPVDLPGGVDARLPFSVAMLNGDRTSLGGREDLTDMLEFLCK